MDLLLKFNFGFPIVNSPLLIVKFIGPYIHRTSMKIPVYEVFHLLFSDGSYNHILL